MSVDGGARGKVQDSWVPILAAVKAVSVTTTGVKLTYTVPAGKVARIANCQASATSGTLATGAGVLRKNVVTGGNTYIVDTGTITASIAALAETQADWYLAAGDAVNWEVQPAFATGSADFLISGEERLVE